MDMGTRHSDDEGGFEDAVEDIPRTRTLPSDLPKSLDDRQPVRNYGAETEMYDAWQGMGAPVFAMGSALLKASLIRVQANRNS